MSSYEYTHSTNAGPDLTICSFDESEPRIWVSSNQQPGGIGSYIPNADVPTVALELLKAAGQESVIVPKSMERACQGGPVVECGSGQAYVSALATEDPDVILARAANLLVIAEHLRAKATREAAEKAEAEAAEKKLQERRDALAKDLTSLNYAYDDFSAGSYLLKAIDRIIELEDGASRD